MKIFLTGTTLLLTGCAGNAYEPKLPADHPANPAAAVAEMPPPSQTLALPDGTAARSHDPLQMIVQPPQAVAGHDHGAAQPATTQSTTLYVCPMHPKVTSTDPNARCPECGMRLELHEEKGAHHGHH